MLLFIDSLIQGDYSALKIKSVIVGIMWLFVLVAIAVDLRSGYSKAKQRGEARNSYGLRRTVSKFTLYYSCLLLAFMVDVIVMYVISSFNFIIPAIPYITIIGSAYLIYVEARSVMEKAEEKEKVRLTKNLSEFIIFLENKDDVMKAIAEFLKQQNINKNDNEDNTGIQEQ